MRAALGLTFALIAGAVLASCFPTKDNPVYCTSCDMAAGSDMRGNQARDMEPPLPDLSNPCKSNPDCASHPSTPVCDTASGACVACLTSTDCTTAAAPVCTNKMCGGCATADDCMRFSSTPVCQTTSGTCVQCLTNKDCDSIHETCNTMTNQCEACTTNAQCTSGLCCPSTGTLPGNASCTSVDSNSAPGKCINETDLLYVNNAAASPACSDGNGCSFAAPCCTVQTGLNASAASHKQVIVFAGNTYTEALAANPTKNVGAAYVATAIGVNGPVVKPASGALLIASGASSSTINVNVTFDGFTFDGTTGTAMQCNGDGVSYADTMMTMLRSTITNGTAIGIAAATECTLTMDQDVVSNNKGGGISLAATNFSLTNLLVENNGKSDSSVGAGDGSGFGGINITSTGQDRAHMIMFNNTVVNNSDSALGTTPAGIGCSVVTTLANTVAFQNQGPTGAPVAALCMADHSAYATAAGTNQDLTSCTAVQLFVAAASGNYKPNPASTTTPCSLIGDGTTTFMSVAAPNHDLSGNSRPAAGPIDIGCYQH